jgi:hypothetical protein
LLPLQQGQGGQQTDAPAIGGGRRLFEVLPSRVELEIVRVIDTGVRAGTLRALETAHERCGCGRAVAEASRLLALDIFQVQRFGARSSSGLMRSTALLVMVIVLTADSARWPHRDGSGRRAVGLGRAGDD